MTDIASLWASLDEEPAPTGGGLLRRRLPFADYDVYLTQERPSRLPGFLVSVTEKPGTLWKELRSSQGLEVRVEARPGVTPTLQLRERDTRFHEIFTALVTDLVRGTEGLQLVPPDERPLLLDFIGGRIARWQACLKTHSDGLSSEKRAGLFGELSTIDGLIGAGADPFLVVDKWTGPSEAVQDFQFRSIALEVKASRQTQPTNVRISSERQLDNSTHERLLLVHYGLDERSDGIGRSLPEQVAETRRVVGPSSLAGLLLDDQLIQYGYLDLHAPRYGDSSYSIRGVDYFDVRDPMPRIVEADLPIGVGRVSYDLSLASCEPFRIDCSAAISLFGGLRP